MYPLMWVDYIDALLDNEPIFKVTEGVTKDAPTKARTPKSKSNLTTPTTRSIASAQLEDCLNVVSYLGRGIYRL